MSKAKIKNQVILQIVHNKVEEMGKDFVYNPTGQGPCDYTIAASNMTNLPIEGPAGKTPCLVGAVLLGLVAQDLIRQAEYDLVVKNGGPFRTLFQTNDKAMLNLRRKFTKSQVEYLQLLQTIQDNGGTWGFAELVSNSFIEDISFF